MKRILFVICALIATSVVQIHPMQADGKAEPKVSLSGYSEVLRNSLEAGTYDCRIISVAVLMAALGLYGAYNGGNPVWNTLALFCGAFMGLMTLDGGGRLWVVLYDMIGEAISKKLTKSSLSAGSESAH